jgi:hypothetical protein
MLPPRLLKGTAPMCPPPPTTHPLLATCCVQQVAPSEPHPSGSPWACGAGGWCTRRAPRRPHPEPNLLGYLPTCIPTQPATPCASCRAPLRSYPGRHPPCGPARAAALAPSSGMCQLEAPHHASHPSHTCPPRACKCRACTPSLPLLHPTRQKVASGTMGPVTSHSAGWQLDLVPSGC